MGAAIDLSFFLSRCEPLSDTDRDTIADTDQERYESDTDTIRATDESSIVPGNNTDGNDKAASPAPGTIKLSEICFDVEMALRQLELLGFRPGEVPFIRAFPAKGDPRCNDIKNSRSNNRSRRFDTKEIERWNREGLGLYLTINAGGSKKAEIESCRAIFYEHDDMPKEEQLFLWQALGLPEPTFQIDTGGKSVHSFWVFDKPIAPAQWSWQADDKQWYGLQADLIAHAGADTALVDLPRVMRLAGAWHVTYDVDTHESYATGQTVIVSQSGKRYSYEEMRSVIPERQPVVTIDVDVVDEEEDDDNETTATTVAPSKSNKSKKTKAAKPIETDGSVLDFRTVSHLIPTWNDSARPGWAAFQCPVHTRDGQQHSTNQIHVNDSSGAWKVWCGCDHKEVYRAVCEMVGFEVPKPERMPTFLRLNDGTLYPAEGQDKEAAMAYIAIPKNEEKVRAKISARYGKSNDSGNGKGNGNGNDSNNNGNGTRGKKGNDSRSGKPPNVNVFAQLLKEQYGNHYRYCDEESQWYAWAEKKWEPQSDHLIDTWILEQVEALGFVELTPNYIDNIRKYLKRKLTVKKWREWDRSKYVAFSNGILEIDSGKLIPHTPDSGFTSFLPFEYSPLLVTGVSPIETLKINCPHIYDLFNRSMRGQQKRVLKLLATINATIKHRFHDLQLFTHIQGDPGTGKNTFTNTLGKIVGEENRLHTNPKALEKPDELAAVVTKQLVVCADVRKQVENVQAFLNLTGGTPIHYRKLFKDRGEKKFYGHLVVVSNTPIFAGDTTGIDRRLNLIEFENPIPAEVRDGAFEAKLDAEIPTLIQVALALTDKAVSDLLKGVGAGEIPEYRELAWERKCEEDTMAAWANEKLIRDPEGFVPIGDADKTPEGEFKTLTAYGSYLAYCAADGNRYPVSRGTFCKRVEKMIQQAIGWKEVKRDRNGQARGYEKVRLRKPESDYQTPFISELLRRESEAREAMTANDSIWRKMTGTPNAYAASDMSANVSDDRNVTGNQNAPNAYAASDMSAMTANFPKNSETQKSNSTDPTRTNKTSLDNSDNDIEVGKSENVAGLLAKHAQGDDSSSRHVADMNESLLAKRPTDEASELAGTNDLLLAGGENEVEWYRQLLEAEYGRELLEALEAADREFYEGGSVTAESDSDNKDALVEATLPAEPYADAAQSKTPNVEVNETTPNLVGRVIRGTAKYASTHGKVHRILRQEAEYLYWGDGDCDCCTIAEIEMGTWEVLTNENET